MPVHYVHHFADALAVIAYGHPDQTVAEFAAGMHHRIAEELFHFEPEPPSVFRQRHRDKPGGDDPEAAEFEHKQSQSRNHYLRAARAR